MKCKESIELFSYKDGFNRREYLVVDHIKQQAYVVRSPDHFDNMTVLSDLVRFMNEYKLFGDRDFATLDINLGLHRYAAIYSNKRRAVDYAGITERMRSSQQDFEGPSS